jgi:DNA-binding transcriptional regulator GbsR (MarR family)
LIFQESTSSKDKIQSSKRENYSKDKNKTIYVNENIDKTLNKEFNEKSFKEVKNTKVDYEMQDSKINSNIKNEIEHLDDEIKELQNKLKTMIKSNKN